MKKTIVLIIGICMVIVGGIFYKFSIADTSVDPALNSLLAMPGVKPGTKDVFDEVGVKSAEDIQYEENVKNIKFIYGNQLFYVYKNTLEDKDMQQALKRLHLIIDTDEGLQVKYKGKEVKSIAQ